MQAALFEDHTAPAPEEDFWQTPSDAIDPILPILSDRIAQRSFGIVDPGCGLGNLMAATQELHPDWTLGVEIDPVRATESAKRMTGSPGLIQCADFVNRVTDWGIGFQKQLVVVLGNPPYTKPRETIGLEFMERSIELAETSGGIVCLLLPLDFATGVERCARVHSKHRSALYPLRRRPKFGGNTTGERPVAWYLFDLGNPYSEWRPIG